jgi:hypothetical protein
MLIRKGQKPILISYSYLVKSQEIRNQFGREVSKDISLSNKNIHLCNMIMQANVVMKTQAMKLILRRQIFKNDWKKRSQNKEWR